MIAALGELLRPVVHAGFCACTTALTLIAALWLVRHDSSGLPIQWILYYPLCLMLVLAFAGGTAVWLGLRSHFEANRHAEDTEH